MWQLLTSTTSRVHGAERLFFVWKYVFTDLCCCIQRHLRCPALFWSDITTWWDIKHIWIDNSSVSECDPKLLYCVLICCELLLLVIESEKPPVLLISTNTVFSGCSSLRIASFSFPASKIYSPTGGNGGCNKCGQFCSNRIFIWSLSKQRQLQSRSLFSDYPHKILEHKILETNISLWVNVHLGLHWVQVQLGDPFLSLNSTFQEFNLDWTLNLHLGMYLLVSGVSCSPLPACYPPLLNTLSCL